MLQERCQDSPGLCIYHLGVEVTFHTEQDTQHSDKHMLQNCTIRYGNLMQLNVAAAVSMKTSCGRWQ
jgi:hypothetical protein